MGFVDNSHWAQTCLGFRALVFCWSNLRPEKKKTEQRGLCRVDAVADLHGFDYCCREGDHGIGINERHVSVTLGHFFQERNHVSNQ